MSTDLCAACGMCCDGTLYSYVTLLDDDVAKLKKYPQLKLLPRSGQLTFDQPCALHDGRACTQYRDRPDSCSRYFCKLLQRVGSDEVTEHEAMLIIQEGKALVENVKEYVALEPGSPMAMVTWDSPPEGADEEARLAWDRARNHLFRHFLGQPVPEKKPA